MADTHINETEKASIPGYLKVGKIIAYALYAWVLFGIIMLFMRIFLLAFSANSTTPFVDFVYRTSANFLEPFRGIFPPRTVGDTGYLDIAALFAILCYAFLAWGVSALIHYLQAKTVEHAAEAQEHYDQLHHVDAETEAEATHVTPTSPLTPPRRFVG